MKTGQTFGWRCGRMGLLAGVLSMAMLAQGTAYVSLSAPAISTNGVPLSVAGMPSIKFGVVPTLGITATVDVGRAVQSLRVGFAYTNAPTDIGYVTLAGNPSGGSFAGQMPSLAVGAVQYWYEAVTDGDGATMVRYPAVTNLYYQTTSDLGSNRAPVPSTWGLNGTTKTNPTGVPAGSGETGWLVQNVSFLDAYPDTIALNSGTNAPTGVITNTYIRSPKLDGVGSVFFEAIPRYLEEDTYQVAVQLATSVGGPWTNLATVTVPVSASYTAFHIPVYDYRQVFIRFWRVGDTYTSRNIIVRNIVLSPPPADVVMSDPSIIAPGYPSANTPITFQSHVASAYTNYPATNFQTELVWRRGTNAWNTTAMEETGSGHYEVTLDPLPLGQVEYYTRVAFKGMSYRYVQGTNTYDDLRSPAYLGWDGSSDTNTVQTSRETPTPRKFRVRMFDSNHDAVELRRHDTDETMEMQLVDDHTWQAVLYLTNAVSMPVEFAGVLPYFEGTNAYSAFDQMWGDSDQLTINPPLAGSAEENADDILVDMNYVGFVMFRVNVTNGLYQVRRAAFQDFNEWQASAVYFDESLGLFAIEEFEANFNSLADSQPAYVYASIDGTATNTFSPPSAPVQYVEDWRTENAWVTPDRFPPTNYVSGTPSANRAIRINAGVGTVQSSAAIHTRGKDAIRFRHRMAFGDEYAAYHRKGFAWKGYKLTARVIPSQISPANPTFSLVGNYQDPDNYYELRVRQIRNLTANANTGREDVQFHVYRKKDGTSTLLGTGSTTFNARVLTDGAWEVALQITNNTANTENRIYVYAGYGAATNTLSVTDSSPGILLDGGTIGLNVQDTVALFTNITLTAAPGGGAYPGFTNNQGDWYLGGVPLGGTTGQTRWTYTGGSLSRPLPSVSFEVRSVRTGESTALPDQPAWTTVTGGSLLSSNLVYTSASIDLKTWDYTFLQFRPLLSDGMLVIDDLLTRDWRGLTVTDPADVPQNDPYTNTVWRGTEAYVATRTGSKMLELTRSRANPSLRQMLVSPVLDDGVGTVSFNYQVSGGTVDFAVERTSFDGMVAEEDPWEAIDTLSVASGVSGEFFLPVRTNMMGRVRVRVLDTTAAAATLWLDNLKVTSYPKKDNTSWEGYNILVNAPGTNPTTDPLQFEPGDTSTRTAYLNDGPTNTVPPSAVFDEDLPYIQSPEIGTGIGEIGFWVRSWDPNATYPGKLRLMMAPTAESTNWVEVTLADPVADAAYKSALANITNTTYQYVSIEIFDKDNKVLRLYSETNQASRVAVDNVIVTEPVRSSIDILSVTMTPDIPLADDPVHVNVQLGNPRMNPENIRVFLDYHVGTNQWGMANWGANSNAFQSIELETTTNEYSFATPAGDPIPAQPVDEVVQYRVVVTYEGTFPSPVYFSGFTNPDWYEPINLNEQYSASGFSPYYFVFSCPTGAVFFNEFFNAFATDSVTARKNQEFIELIGPVNAPLANWRVDVVNATGSSIEDNVQTSYKLPAGSYLQGGTNGWGFFVLGDTGPAISNLVNYYFPDGGNPATTPVTTAVLPQSGGFRLVRSMGAYVDRISYGSSSIAQTNMVSRGYTFTKTRDVLNPDYGIGLSGSLQTFSLGWGYATTISKSPGGMNPLEAMFLGDNPYTFDVPDPEPDPVAALAVEILNIQLASGQVTVTASAWSTNEVTDLTGWTGVLETNSSPSGTGWGAAVETETAFTTEGEYPFTIPETDSPVFFRIKASIPDPQ